jgi:hypothetical protein
VTKVLFVNSNTPDYLADGVFHGLRTLLGAAAIDFPKAEYLYASFPAGQLERLWGRGFTLYRLLEDVEVHRHHMLWRALEGEFDLVVFGDIWRSFGVWSEWGPRLKAAGCPMAVLDGHDTPRPYPYSFFWWRRRYWWMLPRAHNRAPYFKREVTAATRWFASYLMLPPPIARRFDAAPIAFSIPPEKIVAAPPVKEKDFPAHIVDPELASIVGGETAHAFEREEDYRADLQSSRFGITTKRRGWDALRHYEIAASGAVPCFRDLHRKPPRCPPFGLDASNCISYRSARELLTTIKRLTPEQYAELQQGALAWAWANTTTARAEALLDACGVEHPTPGR